MHSSLGIAYSKVLDFGHSQVWGFEVLVRTHGTSSDSKVLGTVSYCVVGSATGKRSLTYWRAPSSLGISVP